MADTPPTGARPDRDLIGLLDHALGMVVGHLTPEHRAHLRERVERLGLDDHVERHCSDAVRRVLLDRPNAAVVNPDGGRVLHGEATSEPAQREHGTTVEEGSAAVSAIPTE